MANRWLASLGRISDDDFLLRWMVHRVAELTEKAHHSKGSLQEDAKKEATELILEVWRHLERVHRRWTEPEPNLLSDIATMFWGKEPENMPDFSEE